MDIKQLIKQYLEGMRAQQQDNQKQGYMLEGAIQFATQLLEALPESTEGGDDPPPSDE